MDSIIHTLLQSDEPAVRYRLSANVLGQDPGGIECQALRQQIWTSPRVQTLLSERNEDGRIPHHAYKTLQEVGRSPLGAGSAARPGLPGGKGLLSSHGEAGQRAIACQLGWHEQIAHE